MLYTWCHMLCHTCHFISTLLIFYLLNNLFKKLESLNQFPDFNNYLIFVLTKLKTEGKLLCNLSENLI